MAAYHKAFVQAKGQKPIWGPAELGIVDGLLKAIGPQADPLEVGRRARAMFNLAGRFPVEAGGDLRTLRAHWDKFATDEGQALRSNKEELKKQKDQSILEQFGYAEED